MIRYLGFILTTTFCLFQLNSNAQNFGLFGGVGFNKEKINQHVGLNMSIPLSNSSAIESGLAYSNKKSSEFIYNYDIGSQTLDVEQNIEAHYIEAPLLFKMGFDIGKFHLFGNVGPYFGYGISGKVKYNSSVWIWETRTYDYTQEINNKIDIGMNYGLGVAYNSLQLRTMYLDGLTNVVNSSKNKELRLSLVYMFKEKKKEFVKKEPKDNKFIKTILKAIKTTELGLISGVNFDQTGNYNILVDRSYDLTVSYTPLVKNFKGYHFGAVFKTPISDNLSFKPALIYRTKSSEFKAGYTGHFMGDVDHYEYEGAIKLSIIDIPLNISVDIPVEKFVLNLYCGPYLSYGLFGNNKYSTSFTNTIPDPLGGHIVTTSSSDYDGAIIWNRGMFQPKRFEIGFNYGLGIEFHNFQLLSSFNMSKLSKETKKNSLNDRVIQVSLAYFFNKKSKEK